MKYCVPRSTKLVDTIQQQRTASERAQKLAYLTMAWTPRKRHTIDSAYASKAPSSFKLSLKAVSTAVLSERWGSKNLRVVSPGAAEMAEGKSMFSGPRTFSIPTPSGSPSYPGRSLCHRQKQCFLSWWTIGQPGSEWNLMISTSGDANHCPRDGRGAIAEIRCSSADACRPQKQNEGVCDP